MSGELSCSPSAVHILTPTLSLEGLSYPDQPRLLVWDDNTAAACQAQEMKRKMRLSRIEDECSRMRRPPRVRSSQRPALRLINSCPATRVGITYKDMGAIQDRFEWLNRDKATDEVYCSVCIGRVERAPVHLTRNSKSEVKWQLLSPRGRSLVPMVEMHSFSSLHAWSAAVHVQEMDSRGENRYTL